MLVILLLVAGATASALPYAARDKRHRAPCDYYWDMIVSGTVYCDARKTRFPHEVKVTLMDWDGNEDDVAEYRGHEEHMKDIMPSLIVTQGRFGVGGMLDDGFALLRAEPYLLVEGVCSVENYNGVVERKHFTEKFGLPCDYGCRDRDEGPITISGIVIILDGASESPICD